MRRTSPLLACLFAAAIASPSLAAWPNQPNLNVLISNANSDQTNPAVASDGAGGAIVAWLDFRGGTSDIYAHHILASGSVDPAWPANGRQICGAIDNQYYARIVSDGAGGAIICWEDWRAGGSSDIYAQRVLASGIVDPLWPVNGRALCNATANQMIPQMVSDGAGGAIVTWQDVRSGTNFDIYAQHVLASGAVDPLWPANGRSLCTAVQNQLYPEIASDAAGGAIVAWQDQRAAGPDDIYATRVLSSGALGTGFPADGAAICTAASTQAELSLVSDGIGGAIITWQDSRGGAPDIYAQHLLGSGNYDPEWTGNGRVICAAASSQFYPSITTDGAGGALISWTDYRTGFGDIYAHHVQSWGVVDPAWPVDGRAICTSTGEQFSSTIATDGAGGAFVAWEDQRISSSNVYVHHVLPAGTVDSAWPVDGRAMTTAPRDQSAPSIVPDGAGGVIAGWHDYRTASNDIYAQRVGRYGYLGTPEAEIASVADVPNDQGGVVKVSWYRSYVEDDATTPVTSYRLFRSVPPNLAQSLIAGGEHVIHSLDAEALEPGDLVAASPGEFDAYFWEYVDQITADYLPNYSYLAPTAQDSTGDGNPLTAFMVQARAAGNRHWESLAATGYSADDLAPAAPAPFTGTYDSGTSTLHWNPNLEADLAGYRLYRGTAAGFIPSPSNLIAAPSDTGHVDAAGAPFVYKLTAVDIHGNESLVATLVPSGALAVGDRAESGTFLALGGANPSQGPRTLRFGLARAGHADLSLFDAGGRRLRTLVSGPLEAGEHQARWDGRDEAGNRVAAGLYFVRLEVDGMALVRRVATLR